MTILIENLQAVSVAFSETHFTVALSDGRFISTPLHWFPRLAYGTTAEREIYEIIDGAIHWPELDEDIEIMALLNGAKSGEGEKSLHRFRQWMQARRAGKTSAPFALAFANPLAVEP